MPLRLMLVGSALLIASCASTTDIETRYSDAGNAEPAQHLLIAARTPDQAKRRDWEQACGTVFDTIPEITLSSQPLPGWYKPGTQALEQWSQAHGVDRILLADITNLLIGKPRFPDDDVPSADSDADSNAQWTFTFNGQTPDSAPPPAKQDVRLAWLTPDGQRHWAGLASSREANEVAAIATSQCRALRATLQEKDLL